jgi:3-phosphoshikimate 1-carboxyvinyltransferase
VKESDRIASIAHNLRAMGAQVIELSDGLEIHGRAPLRGARVPSFNDHRIAMAFAVAGLFADGETVVQDVECVRESYPNFEQALDDLADPKRMRTTTPVISSLVPAREEE